MKSKTQHKEWFAEWFDSPYYHLLYQNRNYTEADAFIRRLLEQLKPAAGTHVLDLACGKGRHALAISQHGLEVTGVDLSPESIREAQKNASENLHFAVHDMRELIPGQRFNYVFNLFTSFGYFEDEADNLKVLNAIHEMLLPGGELIIDFMNATKVIAELVPSEQKQCGEVRFELTRQHNGKHIIKHIQFTDQGQDYHYQEKVQALTRQHFASLLNQSGFEIIQEWGNYALNKFDTETSPRLIIHARKC